MAYLDAQLAELGDQDARFSLLRSCGVAFLQLGGLAAAQPTASAGGHDGGGCGGSGGGGCGDSDGGASSMLFPKVASIIQETAASGARLLEVERLRLTCLTQLMGGQVAPGISSDGPVVTHIVGLLDPGPAPPPSPEQLLRAVCEQVGGETAVAVLREGLLAQAMHIVMPR